MDNITGMVECFQALVLRDLTRLGQVSGLIIGNSRYIYKCLELLLEVDLDISEIEVYSVIPDRNVSVLVFSGC